MTDYKNFIEFQEQIGKVKRLHRTGWVVRQVPEPETVAAHSWRMALMAVYKEKELKEMGVDTDHIVEMCLLHDIGESVVGDIIPEIHQTGSQKISDEKKKQIETEAVKFLADKYRFPKLAAAFDEYEDQKTLASKVVKNLDKLDMLLQAYEYLRAYPDLVRLNEFMTYNEKEVNLPLFAADLQEIKARQFDNKENKNGFIDVSILAGKLKHQAYNPPATDIPNYDTEAAHLFRMSVMALYLKNAPELVRSIISQKSPEKDSAKKMLFDLEILESIQQAYEYSKLYPNDKKLNAYIRQSANKIRTPALRKLIPVKQEYSLRSQRNNPKER